MKRLSGADQAKLGKLLQEVARLESVLAGGDLNSMTKTALLGFVADAKGRIEGLEAKERELENAETQRSSHDLAYAMAERETALNAAEREQFCNFMKEDHFTQRDFGALGSFYQHSWDKLTEGGKVQMDYRVWEGVRRGEFQFSELPAVMKEKHAQRVEVSLERSGNPELAAIPEQDRSDFLQARTKGEKEQSYTILDRPSFAQHVALSATAREDAIKAQSSEAGPVKAPYSPNTDDAAPRRDSIKLNLEKLQLLDDHEASQRPPLSGYAGNSKGNEPAGLPGR